MSIMNIQSGMNSFNHNYLVSNRKKSKKADEHEGTMLNGDGLVGYNIDLLNGREHLTIENLNHEIIGAESNLSLVQTAACALQSLENQLSSISNFVREIADSEESETTGTSATMLELQKLLNEFDQIATQTQYGKDRLLDGSHSVKAIVNGEDLEMVEIGENVHSSTVRGYPVMIQQSASRAFLKGKIPLSQNLIERGEQMLVREGNSLIKFTSRSGDDLVQTLKRFQMLIKKHGLPIEVDCFDDGKLMLQHLNYGSQYQFGAASTTPGVLSSESGQIELSYPGRDVVGSINGEPCIGKGQILEVLDPSSKVAGLRVRYFGKSSSDEPKDVGSVSVFQNAYQFESGFMKPKIQRLGLQSMMTENLGKGVPNLSGFQSLADIAVESQDQVSDSLKVLEKAFEEITSTREKVEWFNDDHLKNHLNVLKVEHDHRYRGMVLRDDGEKARKMAEITKEQIILEGGKSVLVQADQKPQTVMSLLK